MTIKDNIKIALTGLRAQRVRSGLTILGVIVGIAAIILVTSLGNSAQDLILGQVQGLGPKNIFILPGSPKGRGNFSPASLLENTLTNEDLRSLQNKNNLPNSVRVTPVTFGKAKGIFENNDYQVTVIGGDAYIFNLLNIFPETGESFTADDVSSRAEVVVIGKNVAEGLFDNISQATGSKIKIKDKNYRVIGVLPVKGSSSLFASDDSVIMPYTTAQQYVLGTRFFQRIAVEVDSEDNIKIAVNDINNIMRNNHNITNPDKDDFNVQTQEDLVKTVKSITTVLTVLLTSVAAISLVVGGIGIMNIMFVSVTERTREIGLRKALGATSKNILTQFLIESVFLTLIGGILGVLTGSLLGWLSSFILGKVTNLAFSFAFPLTGALWGIVISTLVGLLFGLAPAKKAANKSPMEALRYE